ncbi:2-isopropylmalate synthase [uncultured Mailhella sp.]|uniref:2-isopropylmalate synthase n=1 Tax=uncultured Mailhella sp. TaxID=1981031 RepID=UPI0026257F8A|nr:2-isopropylmalate synthase [uncultured Mailhella sp.]
MSDRVIIFDTTLRDGEQSPGATMDLPEKLRIARQLEKLGVDVIEAGFPAASEGDFEAVKAIAQAVENVQVAGLARANLKDVDRAWEAVKLARHPRIHTFIATSPIHMQYKLRKSPDEVVAMAVAAVTRAASYTDNVEFSCEDASRSDWDYLVRVVTAAIDAGATTINLPDTVGFAQPDEYGALIRYVIEHTPNAQKAVFSVHCHDDLGLAVANSLSAVKNGARQVELCLSGIGERAGNASLEEFVMALKLRPEYYGVECSINNEQLYPSCHLLSLIIGRPIPANKAVIGSNAFAHESGIHQDGMLKNRNTYEIMTPQAVGRKSTDIVIGKHSGRNAVRTRLEELGYPLNEEQVDAVFHAMKALADKKAHIHDEDLEALVFSEVYRMRVPDRFHLNNVAVQTSMGSTMPATAAVVLQDRDREVRLAGFGAGPIDAAFNVISQLCGTRAELEKFSITAITGGTDAQGEVTVHLRDGRYTAVGRGSDLDIIVASAKAYIDALNRLEHKEKDVISYKENPTD